MTLMTHRGGWLATPGDLAAVPVPEDTPSYRAVPYPRLIEEVKLHLPRFGLTIQREDYALAREGQQMFGVLTCSNGVPSKQYGIAIGIRSSYDRSLSVQLVAGGRVTVCDNLLFSGESLATRKHSVHVFRDLPLITYELLSGVSTQKQRMADEIAAMEARELDAPLVHHLMMCAVRENAIPASKLPKVMEEWDHPRHEEFAPRTAWSLMNSFTEVAKVRSPADQMDGTLRLSAVFRSVLSLGS